jgi:hypothetical protein
MHSDTAWLALADCLTRQGEPAGEAAHLREWRHRRRADDSSYPGTAAGSLPRTKVVSRRGTTSGGG